MKLLNISVICLLFFLFNNSIYGQITTELAPFNKIEVFGKISVRLEKSSSDSICIKGGGLDIDKIKYSVKDSVLSIKLLSEFSKSIKISITVKFQELTSIKVKAGCKIYNRGSIDSDYLYLLVKSGSEADLLINVDSLEVKVNEKAFARLTGSNNYMALKTSTGGDIVSINLSNKITLAKLNGGSAEINVSDYLEATVRNGASLKYIKQPKKIKRKERLGGTIGVVDKL